MSAIRLTKNQGAPRIDPGSYTLELVNVRNVQVDDFDEPSLKASRIELTLVIRQDPRWDGKQFTDLCTPSLGSRSKLGQIMNALNGGVEIPDGEVDLETFVGRRLQATVRRKDNGYNQIIAETATPLGLADDEGD
jgi:hypothetical protein